MTMLFPHTDSLASLARAAGSKADTQSPSSRVSLWSCLERLSLRSDPESTVFYQSATGSSNPEAEGQTHISKGTATLQEGTLDLNIPIVQLRPYMPGGGRMEREGCI